MSKAPSATFDKERVSAAVEQILLAMGFSLQDPDVVETPRRVADMFEEFCNRNINLTSVLKDGFDNGHRAEGMIVQTNIPYRGMCPHHLMPVIGKASVGYIPRKRVVGLSKLARLVEAAGTRLPAMQEIVTDNIADALVDGLEPIGVIVVTKCEHTCMSCRGVNTPGVVTSVSAVRGAFRDAPSARSEFFDLIS